MRILFLSRWFPYPVTNGSKLRILNLLQGLAAHHDVSLLSFIDPSEAAAADPAGQQAALQALRSVDMAPWKPYRPQSAAARLAFLSSTPRSHVATFSEEMKAKIGLAIDSGNPDLIIASQWTMASYSLYFQGRPALFEEVELGVMHDGFASAGSHWGRLRGSLTWSKQKRYLRQILPAFQSCTVASARERTLLQAIAPSYKHVHVLPNCVRVSEYACSAQTRPHSLVFTGPFRYHANYDAMGWFLREIMPRVQARCPQMELTITGDHGNLPLPPTPNVTLAGFVEDVRSVAAGAAISIAPLRIGGGTRLKILEAMAMRVPVVATSKGAEGLNVKHGEHLLIADTAEAFADAILRLDSDAALRRQLIENAYRLVCAEYDWGVMLAQFLNIVDESAGVNAIGLEEERNLA